MDASVNPDDFTAAAQSAQDRTLLVRFYPKPRPDKAKTAEAGRPIFRDTDYIEIRTPGSRDAVSRPATQRDIERFPEHYERYRKRIAEPLEGTPLSEWPSMTRSMAEELSFINIRTVEALASVADTHMAKFRGLSTLKRKAQDWLALAEDDAPLVRLQGELATRDATIAAQAATIEDLAARMSAMEATQAAQPKPQGAPAATVGAVGDSLNSASLDEDVTEPPPEPPVVTRRRQRRASKAQE